MIVVLPYLLFLRPKLCRLCVNNHIIIGVKSFDDIRGNLKKKIPNILAFGCQRSFPKLCGNNPTFMGIILFLMGFIYKFSQSILACIHMEIK